jgi:hypothetical protein
LYLSTLNLWEKYCYSVYWLWHKNLNAVIIYCALICAHLVLFKLCLGCGL